VRYQPFKPDNPSSKKPDTIAALTPQRATYLQPQGRFIIALVGTLIAVLSIALLLGREAQAETTQPVNDLAASVQEETTPAQQEPAPELTAPTQDQTTQPVSDKTAPVEEQAAPVEDQVAPTQQATEPVVSTIEDTAEPVEQGADTAAQTAEPVGGSLQQAANPVVGTAEQTTQPIEETVDPIVKPVQNTVSPVIDPIVKPVEAGPVQQTDLPVGGSPVGSSPVSPTPQPIDPLKGQTRQTAQPVAAPAASDPMLRAEGPPVAGPSLEAGSLQASREPLVTRLEGNAPIPSAARVSASSAPHEVAAPESAPADTEQASLTATMGGGRLAFPFFSEGDHSSILDSATATTVHDASGQAPQPLPYSGTLPVLPAPTSSSASGGSSSSSGADRDLKGVLASFLILILGGKLVWDARDFLKPDSAFQLPIKQPG
jgi:hypothetical protein